MTKKPNSADALSIATLCDTKAAELRESLPTIAQAFTDAAAMIRAQHDALSPEKCLHVITFTVTKDMVDSGRESRPPGKYCMTCGELVPPPPKPKREKADKKTEAAGGDDECGGSYNNGSSACMKPAGHEGPCGSGSIQNQGDEA